MSPMWLLAACFPQPEGTFVGNPSITAYVASTPDQAARSGLLVADRVLLDDCSGGDPLETGAMTLRFVDGLSPDAFPAPPGAYCGATVEAASFLLEFEEDAGRTTLLLEDRALELPFPFTVEADAATPLQLGGDAWLADLAAVSEPGTYTLDDGPLAEAFLDGIGAGRAADPVTEPLADPPAASPEMLAGRWTLADHPVAPGGAPTTVSPCPDQDQPIPFAVPIAPASMASAGYAGTTVGWCEGEVQFGNDLSPQTHGLADHSDLSVQTVTYNSEPTCPEGRCGRVRAADGTLTDHACEVLAYCLPGADRAEAVGHRW